MFYLRDPNGFIPGTNVTLPTWKQYNTADKHCMQLKYGLLELKAYDSNRVKFWTEDLPNVSRRK